MIIDAHHHFMPLKVYKLFADPSQPSRRVIDEKNDFTFNARLYQTDTHLCDMDYAGVDMAVLTLSQWNVGGAELCRRINDAVAEELVVHGDRFLAAGCVPVADPQAAVAEIDYMIKDLHFHGIALLTSQGPDINLSNRELMWPIYTKACELDVPIFLHPHLKPYGIELDCTINRSIGRGFDIARAALRIIYDVLPEFPDIKFVLPHFGGCLLALKGRVNAFFEPRQDLGMPVPPEIQPLPKTPLELEELGYKAAFEDLFDRLYFDGAGSGGWEPVTRLAMMTVRHDRLLFGCDYPFEIHSGRDIKYYIDSVRNLDIPEESKRGFLGDNLAKLLKLK
ncbi:Amidohydrolase [Neomoorella glycerini]|uniref:Amidohydrolase n=1 Tax=Neomoorella glycerini TaxID=55779 RepID=A0A6I5ZPG8_9FIRM|nr:amidohydrolase family protein [Moorella glycerini]QGP91505.1 Amidohydrolase [Moorella glycerini]